MPNTFGKNAEPLDADADELLDDIELSRRAHLSKARALSVVNVEVPVVVRSGDVGARATVAASGITTELRRHSASCLVGSPLAVGAVFHVTFDQPDLALPATLAICDRCAMLADTTFEVNLQLLQAIDLPVPSDGDR